MPRLALAAAIAALSAASAANAQYLYGVAPGARGGYLVRIDPKTAHATPIGRIFDFGISQAGAGFSCDGKFWAFSHLYEDFGKTIAYTVDLETGKGTVQQTFDATQIEGGVGLEWAYRDQALIWRASENLRVVDLKAGTTTPLLWQRGDGTLSARALSSGVSLARLQGTNALWSAAFDETDPAGRTFFFRIDVDLEKNVATETRLGPTDPDIVSIAASADGTFYAQSDGNLLQLDPQTGAPNVIGAMLDDDGNQWGPPGMAFGPAGVSGCHRPPTCETASPSVGTLWPPDHKMRSVAIDGITQPDHEPFTVTVTGIRQDEPVLSPGSGNFAPDGQASGASALLRSEREGGADGRVYHVQFVADTGFPGGSCTGTVSVCVPHDQGAGVVCKDEGPLYDSTASQ